MTALLSLTNSSSNQSHIIQLPFRPQSEWPHFSKEHSSVSTKSFQNSSCECCNGGDKGRRVLSSLLHPDCLEIRITAWPSEQPREPAGDVEDRKSVV